MTNRLRYNGRDYDRQITAAGGGLEMNHAMVGETLTVDVLTVPVSAGGTPVLFLAAEQEDGDFFYTADGGIFCAADDGPVEFVPGGEGLYYHEDELIGRYFLHELRRTGEFDYVMTFVSAIRILDQSIHPGGVYTGQTAGEMLADIMGGVAYTVDADVAAVQVYGYLPYASRRRNLQMLLMAIGAAVRNAPDGTLRITSLAPEVVSVLGPNRVFFGGSVVDRNPATAVQVTEHNFIPSQETVTVYNKSTINTELIVFREPVHSLTITNGTILESGVNYCRFSGNGAVTITGKRYVHITRVITKGVITGTDADNVKSVTDNTLISPNNASQVAEKLYAYLTVPQSIRAEVLFGPERPGDVVKVVHPYTKKLVEACIRSMSIQMGLTELRAVCEFLIGYRPAGIIAGYQNHALLTGSGTWTVPEGVTRIRVILVGGGTGGTGGSAGANGRTYTTTPVYSGAGGAGGNGGEGGAVFELDIEVTPGMQFVFACGAGGSGGPGGQVNGMSGSIGNPGGDTTFGNLSSSLGQRYAYGYYEPRTGLTLAPSGNAGVAGNSGSYFIINPPGPEVGPPLVYNGVTYQNGQFGTRATRTSDGVWAWGGGGGGAAVGSNGGNGTNGYIDSNNYCRHGNGGTGGNAAAGPDATAYGGGGHGGHGGGGGGYAIGDLPTVTNDVAGTPGNGGRGGTGGRGGDGCIVIYY